MHSQIQGLSKPHCLTIGYKNVLVVYCALPDCVKQSYDACYKHEEAGTDACGSCQEVAWLLFPDRTGHNILQYLLEQGLNQWQICSKLLLLALHEAVHKVLLCSKHTQA